MQAKKRASFTSRWNWWKGGACRRHTQDHRLRYGENPPVRHGADLARHGNAILHVARAGEGQAGGRTLGYFFPGRDPLRIDDRRKAISRTEHYDCHLQDHQRRTDSAALARLLDSSRALRGHYTRSGEGACGEIPKLPGITGG